MKNLLAFFLSLAMAASVFCQAIRPISYNGSNNVVIGATNTNPFTFSNSIAFSTNTLAGATRTNLSLGWTALTNTNGATSLLGFTTNGQVIANTTNALHFTNDNIAFNAGDLRLSNGSFLWGSEMRWSPEDNNFSAPLLFEGTNVAPATRANLGFSTNLNTLWTATNASNARSAVGLGATWLTNTNVSNFTAAIGLGQSNGPTFLGLTVSDLANTNSTDHVAWVDDTGTFFSINAAATRANLLLGLSALTNTSNVTIMRALSGSTNTNHPYSGSISVTGTNNTNTLVFSNGILQSVQ